MPSISDLIAKYFIEVDSALETLSHMSEGQIAGLPSWTLCHRDIAIGYVPAEDFYFVKVTPERTLTTDKVRVVEITSNWGLEAFLAPQKTDFKLGSLPKDMGLWVGDWLAMEADNPFAVPALDQKGLMIFMSGNRLAIDLTPEKARQEAQEHWNNSTIDLPGKRSFVVHLQTTFDRLENLLYLQAFKERRIHRYINTHRKEVLVPFKKCFFEHDIYRGNEKRKADFVLERETGFPALLIELESPGAKLFTKKGEFAERAHHARSQIAEWVEFIEMDSANVQGEMSFLAGRKQRLVIMDKGLAFREKMEASKHTDTIMWTYDMLLEEAKIRWNGVLGEQCRILGIDPSPTLK